MITPDNRRTGAFNVSRRVLLLVAGLVWTFAGGMLLGRGGAWLLKSGDHLVVRLAAALAGGLAFFFLLFNRISLKHVRRIREMEEARPSLFSFFDLKSYVMMAAMISGGILLRTLKLVDPAILYTFYACMGTPLLISAFRFYHSYATYNLG